MLLLDVGHGIEGVQRPDNTVAIGKAKLDFDSLGPWIIPTAAGLGKPCTLAGSR